MGAPALAPPGGRALHIRGTAYPVLLPTFRDPRLHLAAVIFSLHALGQVAFHFRLSITQIAIAIATSAVLELVITFFSRHVIMWPASAMLTGNGVAFILRLPGTQHGDWWTTHGWYYYAGASAVSLLSKYAIKLDGHHIFNPSNFGLVLVFLIFREGRAEPLDFWWGPMDGWMIGALAIIVCGGIAILYRLKILLPVAVPFWLTFAAGIGIIAAAGHAMTARWHVGPVTGFEFWWIIATSPEVLVFTFFMLSDPKTIPATTRGRIAYSVAVAVMATLLIAPARTEFWAKTGLLGALILACAGWPLLKKFARPGAVPWRTLALAGAGLVALYAGGLVAAGIPARPVVLASPLAHTGRLPAIEIHQSKGVFQKLDRKTAREIAADLVGDLQFQTQALARRDIKKLARTATYLRLPELRRQVWAAGTAAIVVPTYRLDRLSLRFTLGQGQGGAIAVARMDGSQQLTTYVGLPPRIVRREQPTSFHQTVDLQLTGRSWLVARIHGPHAVPKLQGPSPLVLAAAKRELGGVRLTDVAKQAGVDFRQDNFRFGTTYDVHSMMGGGVCWLDYNADGWLDLFAVNSYSDNDVATWHTRGGLPTSSLFKNVHGRFVNVSKSAHANVAVQGNGCVAADLNGDGHTDLLITTTTYNVLLWNNGDGTFTDGTRAAGIDAFGTFGWHTGAAVADVNGDGRLDIFVSGYADVNAPANGARGFPLNYKAFRDLLYLNEGPDATGHSHFRDVALQAGVETKHNDHSLGAVFTDVNGDGRPDLLVANDLDPNRLYVNKKAGPLGFQFVESANEFALADRGAGMGVAVSDLNFQNKPDYVFVTNSRGQQHAAYATRCSGEDCGLVDARPQFDPAFGTNFTGWGDSWVDLANSGNQQLLVANGDIPVTSLDRDAGRIQVIARASGNWLDATSLVGAAGLPSVNGRGLAAADWANDGRVGLAVNSIGGRLMLLRSSGGTGHWLEVELKPFVPGAIVTVFTRTNQYSAETRSGSSYLSSEDPRVHFGLGGATKIVELTVRWPNGTVTRKRNLAADRIVAVAP